MTKHLSICLLLTVGVFFFFTPTKGYSETPSSIVIENPKPTCEEKVYSELKFVNEIKEDIDDDFFLAVPSAVVADDEGNVYVFDKKQIKVLKYDKNLKFVAHYGTNGVGPGEFGGQDSGKYFSMAIGYDNLLYIGDRMNRTLHCLTLDLALKNDIKIKSTSRSFPFFVPTPEKNGNFYTTNAFNDREGIIAQINAKGEKTKTLLDRNELNYQLFYEICEQARSSVNSLSSAWLSHDVIKGNKLLVYSKRAGYCYVFEDGRLKKKLKLWPRKALTFYKSHLKSILPEKNAFFPFFIDLIVDRDDENFFYLRYGMPDEKNKMYLYKYDLEGNLIKVLYLKDDPKYSITRLKYKKNHLFYAFGKNKSFELTIKTYKEDNR